MTDLDTRNITLSRELATAVDDAVEAGDYASASDVIGEALRGWKERRELLGYSVEELRHLVQEGLDSGPSVMTMADVKAEARRRWAQTRPG